MIEESPASLRTAALDDAEFNAQIARLRVYFTRWLDLTGLDRWSVHICWMRDGEWSGSDTSLFTCVWQWPYQLGTIHCNVPLCARRQDDEVERAVVHELVHAWTSELDDTRKASDYRDHDERVTSAIAAAVWRVRLMSRGT